MGSKIVFRSNKEPDPLNVIFVYQTKRNDLMPLNIMQSAKQIFTNLRKQGYESEVPTDELWAEIMKVCFIVRTNTLRSALWAYKTAGFISETGANVWKINWEKLSIETSDKKNDEIYKTFGPKKKAK